MVLLRDNTFKTENEVADGAQVDVPDQYPAMKLFTRFPLTFNPCLLPKRNKDKIDRGAGEAKIETTEMSQSDKIATLTGSAMDVMSDFTADTEFKNTNKKKIQPLVTQYCTNPVMAGPELLTHTSNLLDK